MGGITTLSRFESLEALLVKTRQEISCAVRRGRDVSALRALETRISAAIAAEQPQAEPVSPTKAPTRVLRLAAIVPPESVMPTPVPAQNPSYADQIVAVMAATEGHAHPDVRAARKVVANALVALDKALRGAAGGAATAPLPSVRPTNQRSRGAGVVALRDRIAALGVEPRDIRVWARASGHDVPSAGPVPGWVVDLYVAAHPQNDFENENGRTSA